MVGWPLLSTQYVAIQVATGEVFVCTRRAARNMSFQDFTAENGKVDVLLELSGQVGAEWDGSVGV